MSEINPEINRRKIRRRRSLVYASLLLAFGLLGWGTWQYVEREREVRALVNTVTVQEKPVYRFGFQVNGLQEYSHKIKSGQVLASILGAYDVSSDKADKLAGLCRGLFDLRQLRAGADCRFFCRQTDTGRLACKMVYETSKLEYVVFHLGDSPRVEKKVHPHIRKNREVSGIINSSLYETFNRQNLDPALAVLMADIYAWSVDFYRIQQGDRFKIIYEADFVEEKEVAFGNVLAVLFQSSGKDHYAFRYNIPGKGVSYFDESGNSMKRMFLKAPVKFSRISSRYTLRRFHPVSKVFRAHLGTDYAAPTGTPILATANGVVEEATYKSNNGNYVKLKHSGHYQTQYLHMSRIASGIRRGARVSQGQVIGYVGSTGLATGPHVCYRFWKNGKQVDPLKEKLSFSEPLDANLKPEYLKSISLLKSSIDRISYEDSSASNKHQASLR